MHRTSSGSRQRRSLAPRTRRSRPVTRSEPRRSRTSPSARASPSRRSRASLPVGRGRTRDRGAGAGGDRRPRLPAEPAGALVPPPGDPHHRSAGAGQLQPVLRRGGARDRGRRLRRGLQRHPLQLRPLGGQAGDLRRRAPGQAGRWPDPGLVRVDPHASTATMRWSGSSPLGCRASSSTAISARCRSIRCLVDNDRAAIWPASI